MSEWKVPEKQVTNRGFTVYNFRDSYDKECSLQQSSICDDEECLWLGCDRNAPPHLGHEMSPRMHLTQSQAKWLGKMLIAFSKNGTLDVNDIDPCPICGEPAERKRER